MGSSLSTLTGQSNHDQESVRPMSPSKRSPSSVRSRSHNHSVNRSQSRPPSIVNSVIFAEAGIQVSSTSIQTGYQTSSSSRSPRRGDNRCPGWNGQSSDRCPGWNGQSPDSPRSNHRSQRRRLSMDMVEPIPVFGTHSSLNTSMDHDYCRPLAPGSLPGNNRSLPGNNGSLPGNNRLLPGNIPIGSNGSFPGNNSVPSSSIIPTSNHDLNHHQLSPTKYQTSSNHQPSSNHQSMTVGTSNSITINDEPWIIDPESVARTRSPRRSSPAKDQATSFDARNECPPLVPQGQVNHGQSNHGHGQVNQGHGHGQQLPGDPLIHFHSTLLKSEFGLSVSSSDIIAPQSSLPPSSMLNINGVAYVPLSSVNAVYRNSFLFDGFPSVGTPNFNSPNVGIPNDRYPEW